MNGLGLEEGLLRAGVLWAEVPGDGPCSSASDAGRASIHAALVAGLDNGTLRPEVGQEAPLKNAPHGHEAVPVPAPTERSAGS
jgi:hypothetical protein